jgi:predicted secreted Zn-dependent protease
MPTHIYSWKSARTLLLLATSTVTLAAQSAPPTPPPDAHPRGPHAIRIWVSGKQSESIHGSISSADLLKEINAKCTGVFLTDDPTKADYRLEAGRASCCTKKGESKGYKFALFNKSGDAIFSTQTKELKNAVKDMCKVVGH